MENEIDVAVVNSPGNVVLAGSKEAMDVVGNHITSTRRDIFWRKLTTSRAYHSQEMEAIKEPYFKITNGFNVRQTLNSIPFYSTVTGTQVSGQYLTLEHWWKNIRQTVLFKHALQSMFSAGYQFFIEINASPQLAYHVRQTWSQKETSKLLSSNDAVVIQTLPKRSSSQLHLSFLQNCVAHLFTNGVPLSWDKVQGSGSKLFISRPTYPWQETEFWYREDGASEIVTFVAESKIQESKRVATFHPLLGKPIATETLSGLRAWESEIDLHNFSYLSDHKFVESPDPVLPASVYVEMIMAMLLHLSPSTAPVLHSISFVNLLTISSNDSHLIRTRLLPQECSDEGNRFQISVVQNNGSEVILSEGTVILAVYGGYESHGKRKFLIIHCSRGVVKYCAVSSKIEQIAKR